LLRRPNCCTNRPLSILSLDLPANAIDLATGSLRRRSDDLSVRSMKQTRDFALSVVVVFALAQIVRGEEAATVAEEPPNDAATPARHEDAGHTDAPPAETPDAADSDPTFAASGSRHLAVSHSQTAWIDETDDSARFPKAYQIPGTAVWWKFGGYIKGDFIHDFQPAGTTDRWVPSTIPTDDSEGQNTLMQAKATRLNLDVRAPSDWGVVRGFVETDFFNDDAQLRLRHAYVEVGSLLAGQSWTVFTDPDGIPRTLDFESPIAFITLRQAQFRWTETIHDNLTWAVSVENPDTTADDVVFTSLPGDTEQPVPDLVTHLKYKGDLCEWFIAGLFRDLVYRPDGDSSQHHFGAAVNLVGILHPTEQDKLIGQFLVGNGLGRYRSGSDLRLDTPTTVDTVHVVGGCVGVTHEWTDTLSSTGVYSFGVRRVKDFDPPETTRLSNYLAIDLIWEPIDSTSFGIEYLYGDVETRDGSFGSANRIQASVQYNFP